MAKLNIETVPSVKERDLPIFDELDQVAEQIRIRAFNLFADRGFNAGNELDDWFRAEREICWPTAELVEEDNGFEIKVALAGFDRKDINVTANPRELIVKATHRDTRRKAGKNDDIRVRWSEFRSNDVYRHIPLPADIDVNKISAEFKDGILEIAAPRVSQTRTKKKAKKKAKSASGKKKAKKKV
jgi:HSP20 family protein